MQGVPESFISYVDDTTAACRVLDDEDHVAHGRQAVEHGDVRRHFSKCCRRSRFKNREIIEIGNVYLIEIK